MFYAKTFTYSISFNAQDKFMKWVFNTTSFKWEKTSQREVICCQNYQCAQTVFFQLNQACPLGFQYIICPEPSFFSHRAAPGIGFDKLILTEVPVIGVVYLVLSKKCNKAAFT